MTPFRKKCQGKNASLFKIRLQELCQKRFWCLPQYETESEGPSHSPRFRSLVSVRGMIFKSSANFTSKKLSENFVARIAYRHFVDSSTHSALNCHSGALRLNETSSGSYKNAYSSTVAGTGTDIAKTLNNNSSFLNPLCHASSPTIATIRGEVGSDGTRKILESGSSSMIKCVDASSRPKPSDIKKSEKSDVIFFDSQQEDDHLISFDSSSKRDTIEQKQAKDYTNAEDLQNVIELTDIQLMQDNLKSLLHNHEAQNKELFYTFGQKWKTLQDTQKIEIEKFVESSIIPLKKLVSEKMEMIKGLESVLEDKDSEVEALQDTNHWLLFKERIANSEIQEARKAAIQILADHPDGSGPSGQITLKRMGELPQKPWIDACRKKFKPYEWEIKYGELLSLWQERLQDPSWNPFKTVSKGNDAKWIVDESDGSLRLLHNDMGEEVFNSVINALNELNDYNASGRYPIPELWNIKDNRRASLKEVIELLNHRKEYYKSLVT